MISMLQNIPAAVWMAVAAPPRFGRSAMARTMLGESQGKEMGASWLLVNEQLANCIGRSQ